MPHPSLPARTDVAVIGGGQAGLATAYSLQREARRQPFSFVVLDDRAGPGGAWLQTWPSLRLFSPAEWSSLPGWPLPRALAERYPVGEVPAYPGREDVLAYLEAYEKRYALPVVRPVRAERVVQTGEGSYPLSVETDGGAVLARAVVSATGTARAPYVPDVPGRDLFGGVQVHSSAYAGPAPFAGQRVLVVGEGNSGAQILAEVSAASRATWVAQRAPRFLPEDVDGRVLFDQATARYEALKRGENPGRPYSLGDVVQVPSVREARLAGRLGDVRPPPRGFTARGVVWADGTEEAVDAVVWCTGFRPGLSPLEGLGLVGEDGRVAVEGTRALGEGRLWLVGYGQWTGFASATLVGVGRSAKATAAEVAETLAEASGEAPPSGPGRQEKGALRPPPAS